MDTRGSHHYIHCAEVLLCECAHLPKAVLCFSGAGENSEVTFAGSGAAKLYAGETESINGSSKLEGII